jgi:hypothetical protein
MKYPIFILMLLASIILIIVPAKSQSIRTIQADTIFKGYDTGETKSVKIVNHGTSIIYNHSGKLYEMSAITYEHIREIKLEDSLPVTKFSVDDNCKYIIYNTKSDTITLVADYNSGKTIKTIFGMCYLGYNYIYTVDFSNGPDISIIRYNLSSLTPADTFVHKFETDNSHSLRYKNLINIPNTDNIFLSIGGIFLGRGMFDMNYSYYKIDFANDSVQGIDFTQNRTDEGTAYSVLSISEDLNYYVLEKSEYNTTEDADRKHITTCRETNFFVYVSNYKNVGDIKKSEIRKLLKDPELEFYFNGIIVENRYLVFGISRKIQAKSKNPIIIYDLKNNVPFALVDFDVNSFSYDGKFIFSNYRGCLATLSLEQVPVQENNKLTNEYSVSYSNNNLLISSDANKLITISIMNITGEEVESINNIYLTEGSNTIPLNNNLANGLYFCIIQTPEATFSRKFMVIK